MEKEAILRWLNRKIMKEKNVIEPVADLFDRASFTKGYSKGYQEALKEVQDEIRNMK